MNWRQENGTLYLEIGEDDMMCAPFQLPTYCAPGDSLQMMIYDASTNTFFVVAALQH